MEPADCQRIDRRRAADRLIMFWTNLRPTGRRRPRHYNATRRSHFFRHGRRGPLALFSSLLISLVVITDANAQIEGCEASVMSALLAPTGFATWEGSPRAIGPWIFSHAAALRCEDGQCRVNAGLVVDRVALVAGPAWVADGPTLHPTDAGSPAVILSPSPNAIQGQGVVRGAEARLMASSLGPSAFEDADGTLRRVWLDYGRVADEIHVRGRTEIACSTTDEAVCSIGTVVIAFVSYDEQQHECGYLSSPENPYYGW